MLSYTTNDVRNLADSVEILLVLSREITEKDSVRDKLRETAIHLLDEIIIKE